MTSNLATPTITRGELVLTNANQWYQIPGSGIPCSKIRLSAPTSKSPKGSANTSSLVVLESVSAPASASDTAGAWELPTTATGLNYSLVANTNMLWIQAGTAGDVVEYSVQ